jgi:hypothetical protein
MQCNRFWITPNLLVSAFSPSYTIMYFKRVFECVVVVAVQSVFLFENTFINLKKLFLISAHENIKKLILNK